MTDEIRSAKFLLSVKDLDKAPKPAYPEYAFIGRSNVGKSSLINMLTGRKNLAKTSSTPGKTQLINYFLIDEGWYLVDLPGYGYAKRSKAMRAEWDKLIRNYLLTRANLVCTFLLIDARLDPQEKDVGFMEWLGSQQLPFAIVFTKTDKLGKTELQKKLAKYRKFLLKSWTELPPSFISSATDRRGKEDILEYIAGNNRMFLENFRN